MKNSRYTMIHFPLRKRGTKGDLKGNTNMHKVKPT